MPRSRTEETGVRVDINALILYQDIAVDIGANGERNRRNLMLATGRSAPDHRSLVSAKNLLLTAK